MQHHCIFILLVVLLGDLWENELSDCLVVLELEDVLVFVDLHEDIPATELP